MVRKTVSWILFYRTNVRARKGMTCHREEPSSELNLARVELPSGTWESSCEFFLSKVMIKVADRWVWAYLKLSVIEPLATEQETTRSDTCKRNTWSIATLEFWKLGIWQINIELHHHVHYAAHPFSPRYRFIVKIHVLSPRVSSAAHSKLMLSVFVSQLYLGYWYHEANASDTEHLQAYAWEVPITNWNSRCYYSSIETVSPSLASYPALTHIWVTHTILLDIIIYLLFWKNPSLVIEEGVNIQRIARVRALK